jgi:hypothetical protein
MAPRKKILNTLHEVEGIWDDLECDSNNSNGDETG